MNDLTSALTVLGAAIGSKSLIEKVLGPTADYLGGELKDFTEKRLENIGRIFKKAEKKLGNTENFGAVPPRILREIINEGSFVEDELSSEYFAGILASSKSGISRDDRAIAALKKIETMSSYEIRSHYLIYTIIRELFLDQDVEVSKAADKMQIFIPINVFKTDMDIQSNESLSVILSHSIVGLNEKGLVQNYSYGREEFLKETTYANADSDGIVIMPTPMGAQLFLLANGIKDQIDNKFISSKIPVEKLDGITITNGSRKTN